MGELILKLREFDPALPVVVGGYEAGVDALSGSQVTEVLIEQPEDEPNPWMGISRSEMAKEGWYGKYRTVKEGGKPALLIGPTREPQL